MSDVDEYDDDLDTDTDNAPKALRQQVKKLNAELAESRKLIEEFQTRQRQSVIADVLREKNANPKLAKFITRDLEGDVTEESVAKWLEDEGELFGYTPPSPEDEGVAAQQAAISRASTAAPAAQTGITHDFLKNATIAELQQAGIIPTRK